MTPIIDSARIAQQKARKRKHPPSVRKQLLTYIVMGVCILLILFSLTVSWLAGKQTSNLMTDNAQQVARALSSQAILALLTESEENIRPTIQQIMAFPDVLGAGLVTQDGRIFAWQGDAQAEQYFKQINWAEMRSYLVQLEDTEHWYIASAVILSNSQDAESETQLFDAEEEKLGYAIISFSKESLSEINANIILTIVVTGAIVIVALVFIVGSAIQRLLSPLQSLSEVMVYNHETGDHMKSHVQGSREIEQMAQSFNAMMDTLDEQDEKLRSHRDKLEAEVKIRTQELVVARDAALSSSRHKSEFLANMTHELRTPIQSIIGYVDLAKEEAENEGFYDIVPDLDRVTRNADRLLGMINCVLDLSKIEAGRMELNLKSVYLHDLIEGVQEATSPLIPSNNNQFKLEQKCDNLLMRVDHEKLLQVLINLVSNACKFTENGTILLRVSAENDMMTFSVQDTGIGIPEEQQQRIFQQFKQVDGSETRKFAGTGLGLAISKQFCDLMNASISVHSIPGEGSCFTVKIPLSQ
ncbi:MAG: ATP-binding protein [Aestuariibacter sp.]